MTQFESAPPSDYSNSVPTSSPDKKAPYELREQVCLTKGPTTFAKLLFCRITDLAFKQPFRRREGELEVSKKFLAEQFHVSPDTVTRSARLLEKSGVIWTKTRWTGAHEMTWWYIREWADPKLEFDRHTGPNFGRKQGGVSRNTFRGEKGKFTKNPESKRQQQFAAIRAAAIAESQQSTVKAGISPDTVQESALSGQSNQPCQGAAISPVRVQESALTGLTSQPCQGARVSGLNTLKSKSIRGDLEGGKGTPPRDSELGRRLKRFSGELQTQLLEWRQSLNGSFPSRLEKMREGFKLQRRGLAGEARAVIDWKLALLTEILEGPLPPGEKPKAQPPAAPKPPAQPREKMAGLASAMRAAVDGKGGKA